MEVSVKITKNHKTCAKHKISILSGYKDDEETEGLRVTNDKISVSFVEQSFICNQSHEACPKKNSC